MLRTKLMICIIFSVICNVAPGQGQDSNKAEFEKLRQEIESLKRKLESLAAPEPDIDSTDTELEKELAGELGIEIPEQNGTGQESGISQKTLATRQKFFQNMNPNISVIGTALGSYNSQDVPRNIDLLFQEGEFSFQAAVDPFAKADFFIAFGRHSESDLVPPGLDGSVGQPEEHGEEAGLQPEIEEAFVTFLSMPFSTQLKLGKFRSKFGKINETHPHAYNFIDVPLMYSAFFGPEGIADEGASLSWLLPNKSFFQELTFQVTSGPSENASFTRAENNKFLYLAHLKNFFELNDNTTLELGVSGLTGPHAETGANTKMLAADLTLKWRPLRNRQKSFELIAETLISNRQGPAGDITSLGFYSFARYQIARQWFLGGMYDYAEYPAFDTFNRKAYSGILQFLTSEFQKLEIQYRYNQGNFFDDFSEFKLREVFVIGAHGAHQY